MTKAQDARITVLPSGGSGRSARDWGVPLAAAVAVALLAAWFLQHFPATLLAVALVLLAVGRLGPIVREALGARQANVFQGCFDFAGVGLLAVAATQGASGEIARALAALVHG